MRHRTLVRLGCAAGCIAALALSGSATAADPAQPLPVLKAHVSRINDGDSIEVELESAGHARVRFSAIDTPEYDQPYGAKSSAALKAMLPLGSEVELEIVAQDQFHRVVATVWLLSDGKRIYLNEAMLREGTPGAIGYMKDRILRHGTGSARQKLGLWAQPVSEWVYPPEWRFSRTANPRAAHAI